MDPAGFIFIFDVLFCIGLGGERLRAVFAPWSWNARVGGDAFFWPVRVWCGRVRVVFVCASCGARVECFLAEVRG